MQNKLFTTHANRFAPWRKRRFRTDMIAELESHGYQVTIHKTIFGNNIYFGNIQSAYVLTAHYDTATNMAILYPFMKLFGARYGQLLVCLPIVGALILLPQYYFMLVTIFSALLISGLLLPNRYNYNDNSSDVLTVLEHAIANKDNNDFFYALTDNEEKGLLGAKALRDYLKHHNRLGKVKNINIDCVGTGDYFCLASTSSHDYLNDAHNKCSEYRDLMKIDSKLLSSDHFMFGKNGIMITKVNTAKLLNDVYIPHLHTNRDKIIDHSNITEALMFIKKITGESN